MSNDFIETMDLKQEAVANVAPEYPFLQELSQICIVNANGRSVRPDLAFVVDEVLAWRMINNVHDVEHPFGMPTLEFARTTEGRMHVGELFGPLHVPTPVAEQKARLSMATPGARDH